LISPRNEGHRSDFEQETDLRIRFSQEIKGSSTSNGGVAVTSRSSSASLTRTRMQSSTPTPAAAHAGAVAQPWRCRQRLLRPCPIRTKTGPPREARYQGGGGTWVVQRSIEKTLVLLRGGGAALPKSNSDTRSFC